MELFAENWQPGYTTINGQAQNFFSVFSVYFPAAIGILAGANVSGDLKVLYWTTLPFIIVINTEILLKDPNSAIPKGTILAILITSISYAVIAIICAGTTQRSASGCLSTEKNSTCVPKNETYGSYYDEQVNTYTSDKHHFFKTVVITTIAHDVDISIWTFKLCRLFRSYA